MNITKNPKIIIALRITVFLIVMPSFLISLLFVLERVQEKISFLSWMDLAFVFLPFFAALTGLLTSVWNLSRKREFSLLELAIYVFSFLAVVLNFIILYIVISLAENG